MPTLKDVASLAGVSIATVSHVINDTRRVSPSTRARVEEAVMRLGYTLDPAGRMRSLVESVAGGGEAVATETISPHMVERFVPSHQDVKGEIVAAHDSASNQPDALKHPTEHAGTSKAAHMLLRLLRAAQPISRVELARRLGINRSTVTDTFKPLIASGVVLEEPVQHVPGTGRTLGRPSSSLFFNNERDFFIGVHLGVRGTQVGLTTLSGEIHAEEDFDTPADPSDALTLVHARIKKLITQTPARKLRSIGVSVPGPTDAARSKLLYAPHLGWSDVNIVDALRIYSHEHRVSTGEPVPVIVENDATASAMYEARLRLRNTTHNLLNNFILVRSGTGIGVGLVLGGEVYRGTGKGEGIAGEFGHMTIVAGGKPCACGNRGCWERYGSAAAAAALYMGERVQLGGIKAPRYVEIVERAEAGELRAQRTLERIGEYLGIGIGNVIMGVGVPQVIVSGRVVYGWKYIREPLHQAVAQSMAGKLAGWSVEPGEPRGAGLGGALEVAVDDFLTSRLEQ